MGIVPVEEVVGVRAYPNGRWDGVWRLQEMLPPPPQSIVVLENIVTISKTAMFY